MTTRNDESSPWCQANIDHDDNGNQKQHITKTINQTYLVLFVLYLLHIHLCSQQGETIQTQMFEIQQQHCCGHSGLLLLLPASIFVCVNQHILLIVAQKYCQVVADYCVVVIVLLLLSLSLYRFSVVVIIIVLRLLSKDRPVQFQN